MAGNVSPRCGLPILPRLFSERLGSIQKRQQRSLHTLLEEVFPNGHRLLIVSMIGGLQDDESALVQTIWHSIFLVHL